MSAESPKPAKPSKIKRGIPIDEAMRVEHAESIVRPKPNVEADAGTEDNVDQGPHVARVGMPAPDE